MILSDFNRRNSCTRMGNGKRLVTRMHQLGMLNNDSNIESIVKYLKNISIIG